MEEIIQDNINSLKTVNSNKLVYITDAYLSLDYKTLFLCKNAIFIDDVVLEKINNFWLSNIVILLYISKNYKKIKQYKNILEIGSNINSLIPLFFDKNDIIININDNNNDLIILSDYNYFINYDNVLKTIEKYNNKILIVYQCKKPLDDIFINKIKELYKDINIKEKKLLINDKYYIEFCIITNL